MNMSQQQSYRSYFQGHYLFHDQLGNARLISLLDPKFRLGNKGRKILADKLNDAQTYDGAPVKPIYLLVLQDHDGSALTEVYHLVYPAARNSTADQLLTLLNIQPSN